MPSMSIRFIFITFFLIEATQSAPEFACRPPHFSSFPFCNRSLPAAARARSIVSLLSLSEKISLLTDNASSVPRLGLPAYEWWSESLHGIATNGPGVSFNGPIPAATSFPQVLVMAAAFNRSLWFQVGAAIAVEARAMYNKGQAGLTFWAPNINIFRDPRWGRGQETPGEDPMVASAYAIDFVKGFQGGNGDDDLMLSACCKHLTAYDLEKWGNFSRYSFDAVVSEQDMQDTYEPPFRSCIEEGKASCLMCSYNRVNGVPACARPDLFKKARIDWGFKGYITSDCDAVATVYEYQHYSKSPEDAVADVLKAGVDTNCGTYMLRHTESAIKEGKVSEEDIDRALYNLFLVQLRLGLFNGDPSKGKFGLLGTKDVCSKQHRELALAAARQGIVLLKNENNFLPLNKTSVPSLAVIGPMANTTSLGGGYSGFPCDTRTIVEELKMYPTKTNFAAGCHDVACDIDNGFNKAIHVAEEAEYVIIVAGLDLTQETEDNDRTSLLLPGKQMDLIKSIASVSKNPLVLVITGGGPLDVSFAENDPRVASILWIGYPGETGGKALAEIIFGYLNPGGRLPMTWYPESFTKVAMNDMNMRANRSSGYPGRTYRFYTGDTVYNFGHGLSYSNFVYKLLSAPNKLNLLQQSFKHRFNSRYRVLQETKGLNYIYTDELAHCDSLRFSVRVSVRNVGNMSGTHVVMVFVRAPKAVEGTPEKQLVGFDRVHVVPNGRAEAVVEVDPCEHFSSADESGRRVLSVGQHVLMIGDLQHSVSVES